MRTIRLTTAYLRAVERHGVVRGSPIAQRIAAEIRFIEAAEDLPLVDDFEVLLPPAMHCWSRRIPKTGFCLVYLVSEAEVVLVTLQLPSRGSPAVASLTAAAQRGTAPAR